MKILLFAKRNTKEILRDPINLFFALGFPIVLLLLFSVINSAIPTDANNTMFSIEKTAPGIVTFGTAFFALFSGMLLSKDRTTSFLMRLFASPMTAMDFLFGYTLPLLIMAMAQGSITFLVAALLGLPLSINTLLAVLIVLPIAILFVGFGLLCGSFLNDKAVGGICGALLTNIAGWFSGVWIPLDLIGGVFKQIAEVLPFYHSVEAAKEAISGNFTGIIPHISVVLLYAVVFYGLAVLAFRHKMHSQ
ncbi:MAG TPA: ABC transporter permease [Dysgonamonadaceae bacterium]|nr:ABC transporter permease [Dysgonamonadaceae bacterium]